MKPVIVISAVVLVHAAALAIAGCQSETPFQDINSDKNLAEKSPGATGGATVTRDPLPPLPPEPITRDPLPPPPPEQPIRTDAPKPARPEAGSRTYTVKNGDSLHRIARREKVSVKALARANNLSENAILKPKQTLIIPAKSFVGSEPTTGATPKPNTAPKPPVVGDAVPAPDAGGYRIHEVKKGEVLGIIARHYGVTVAKIQELNGITDVKRVRAGSKLRIPHSATTPAPAPATEPQQSLAPSPSPENSLPAPELETSFPPVPAGSGANATPDA